MPSHRASAWGATSSVAPRAILNQPRPLRELADRLAAEQLIDAGSCACLCLHLTGLEHDLDAAVLLVAESLVHGRAFGQTHPVGNDEGWIDLAFLDTVEQVIGPSIHVRLASPNGQSLVHDSAKWNLVEQTAIDARHRQRS